MTDETRLFFNEYSPNWLLIRMKTIKFFLLVLTTLTVSTIFYACDDDDTKGPEKILPQEAISFLNQYLPDNKIIQVEKNPIMAMEPTMYSVTLEQGISVLFGETGMWYNITALDELPESAQILIGTEHLDQLKAKEPNSKIVKLSSVYNYHIQIDLDNNNQYITGFGFESSSIGKLLTTSNAPQAIKNFLTKHGLYEPVKFSFIIQLTETHGDIYRVIISEYMSLTFDKNGKWIHGKEDNYGYQNAGTRNLEKIAEQELPKQVIAAINNTENAPVPLGRLSEVFCFNDNIYGTRFNDKYLLIDKQKGIIPPPNLTAQKLAEDYFSPKELVSFTVNMLPYSFSFTYRYNCNNYYLDLHMGINNEWTTVYCPTVINGLTNYTEIPSTFIKKELPNKITDYLNSSYIQPKIYVISRNSEQYIIGVKGSNILYFDIEGNFIEEVDR